MIFFITFLRALAACFITNAHYVGIYPTDLIANGGLIGDVLFFAVSGYCLYNIKKMSFLQWYGKRIYRIYLPVLIMTTVYFLLGAYNFKEHNAVWWFLYPTYYHFVASIIVLYIPFYIFMRFDFFRNNLLKVMIIIAVVWIVIYVSIYDKNYYHIDTVREPMIRFLFMESMLLGALFRQNDSNIRNKFKIWYPLAAIGAFFVYFTSKLLFSHRGNLAKLQILNQFAIFTLLIFIFITFAGLDSKLEKMPRYIKSIIGFLSSITLEIYLVQYVLIDLIRPIGHFPVNWIVLTASIIGVAFLLHIVCKLIYKLADIIIKKFQPINGRKNDI
mgnify:CR=1 FL=1